MPLNIATINTLAAHVIDALWRTSWQGALFIALIWIFCRLAPALPAASRCWLWRLACVKLVLGLLTIPWPAVTLPDRVAGTIAPAAALVDAGPHIAAQPVHDLAPQANHAMAAAAAQHLSWQAAICIVWLAGIAILLCLAVLQYRALARLLAASKLVDSPEWNRALIDAAGDMPPYLMPRLLSSGETIAPFVTGARSPVIVIPGTHLETFSPARQRLSLLHEMAHVRRRDLLWSLLIAVIAALFFYHPLAWLARREEEVAREEACDAFVLNAQMSAPVEYGALLVELASGRSLQWSGALGMNDNFRFLQRRLQSMKKFSTTSKWGQKATAGVVVAAVIIAMPWTVRGQASAEQTAIVGTWESPFTGEKDKGQRPDLTWIFRRDGTLHMSSSEGAVADGVYNLEPGFLTIDFATATSPKQSPESIARDLGPHRVEYKVANNVMVWLIKDAAEPVGILRRRKDADGVPVDRKSDETIVWAPAILPKHALQLKIALVPGHIMQDGYIVSDEHNTVRHLFGLPQGTIVQGTILLDGDKYQEIMAQMPGAADPIPILFNDGLANPTKIGFRVTSAKAVTFQ